MNANATRGGYCGALGLFYYSETYNGQCTCARDTCAKRTRNAVYSVYQLDSEAKPTGVDIALDFRAIFPFPRLLSAKTQTKLMKGSPTVASVYDVWSRETLGVFNSTYVARNVAHHGCAFIRVTKM